MKPYLISHTIPMEGGGIMKTINKLLEISSRIEHLEKSAEWIAKETATKDSAVSQTATMIYALADDVQERVTQLVKKLEEINDMGPLN